MATGRRPLSVIFIPDWRTANPYQARLGQSLEELGCIVGFDNRINQGNVKSGNVDVIHLHWISQMVGGRNTALAFLRTFLTILKVMAIKLSSVKIVWTIHNLRGHESRHPKLETILGVVMSRIADALIVHTDYAKKAACERFRVRKEAKCRVIPHAGYVGDYENAVGRDEARTRLGLRREDFVYLYFGMVRRYKGIVQLIDAFKDHDDPDAVLVVAGKPSSAEIKELLEEKAAHLRNVRLALDFIPSEDVQVFMNAADVVVLPFETILTSGSLMLAISFGKAVVSRRIGAVTDVVGTRGAIYFDGDKDGLLQALADARSAPIKRMGEDNMQAANRHTWATMAEATAGLYKDILMS